MTQIVDEMYAQENEEVFQDVMLTDRSGNSISLFPNGHAIMDLSGSNEELSLSKLDREDQMMLWIQLAAGNLDALKKLDWNQEATSS